jgi:hypothetical protein
MKRIKSVLLISVVVLGMCSCVKKHDASDIIKTNKLSTNNSTSIEDKKVEIEGIFIKIVLWHNGIYFVVIMVRNMELELFQKS